MYFERSPPSFFFRAKRGENFLHNSNTRAFCAEGAERICFQKLDPATAKNSLCKIAFFFTYPKFSLKSEIFANGRDFRRRPGFSLASEIFAYERDFRRRSKTTPHPPQIFNFCGRRRRPAGPGAPKPPPQAPGPAGRRRRLQKLETKLKKMHKLLLAQTTRRRR